MSALALSDLHEPESEPRILDLRLAEALGFERPRAIRQLLSRNRRELENYGPLATRCGESRGQEFIEHFLNEEQALLICMFARTPKAADVRKQVIEVFMAWRRGAGPQVSRHGGANTLPPWSTERPIDQAIFEGRRRLGLPDIPEQKLALIYKIAPRKRRSPIWDDEEVFVFLVSWHRRVRLTAALKELSERFDAARLPSKSAAHRFWQALDDAIGADWSTHRGDRSAARSLASRPRRKAAKSMVNHAPLPPHVVDSVSRLLAVEIDMDAAIVALAQHFRGGWRPKFWRDAEVLRALTLLHRRVTTEQAAAAICDLFGAARTPGRSSIARYWLVLDKAPGAGRRAGNG